MITPSRQIFWERAALTSLAVILEDCDTTVNEATEQAIVAADQLLAAWRDRFETKARKAGAAA